MHCTHCGTENPDQAVFCMRCGKRLQITNHLEPPSLTPSSASPMGVALHARPLEPGYTAITTSAKWIPRVAIPLATLAWIGLVAVILWAASHVIAT